MYAAPCAHQSRVASAKSSFESYDSGDRFVGFFIILKNASGVVLSFKERQVI